MSGKEPEFTRKAIAILACAFVGWALCAAVMGIGMAVTSLQATLIVHAIAAPLFFGAVSWFYFTRYAYTTPLQTAVLFTGFVIFTDFFVVALAVNRSLEMFTSFLGTWLPFALIFAAVYLVGLRLSDRRLARSV